MELRKKIGVISLGCDKNRVDTEHIMTSCAAHGYEFVGEPTECDVLLVNTCAFLEAAREEAIDAILGAAEYKQAGCSCLVVAGCLPMRYLDEVKAAMPEVDVWLLPERYDDAGAVLDAFFGSAAERRNVPSRLLTTPEHYAYLKIADGCDNKCTYCMIPSIRGAYRSIAPEEIEREARALVTGGADELILVAQDTTRYGTDKPEYGTLAALVRRLAAIDGLERIRLLYCYPECVTDELIDVIAAEPKVAKYLDIPLQHVDDCVLKRMNRRSTYASICALVDKLRVRIPEISIRTTFMVGFPGETEEQFDRMLDFLTKYKLDNVGFFAYSREEATPSARMDGHLPEEEKLRRLARAQTVQERISSEASRSKVGTEVIVRYEGIDYDRSMFIGRMDSSAPDIDPLVYFTAEFAEIGNFYRVRVTDTEGCDLIGEAVAEA